MDAVEEAILNDVVRHENGCWTFKGPRICSVIRVLASLTGTTLAINARMYRAPECQLGAECVNPEHVLTSEQWISRVRRVRDI